jgi:hypothetical protein
VLPTVCDGGYFHLTWRLNDVMIDVVQVKSQEILKQLQSSGETFTQDEKTRILKCEVCDVVVNSSQQLQTHLEGT